MLRAFIVIAAAASALAAPAFGQVRTEARTHAGREIDWPKFVATRTGGQKIYIVAYSRKGLWYTFTDMKGKRLTHLASSIESIEPLSDAEADKAVETADGFQADPPVRTSARVSAPSGARTTSPSARNGDGVAGLVPATPKTRHDYSRPVSPPSYGPPTSGYSGIGSGYSATGIPLNTGPRGGIYHMSKNGNKVYHSRKK